QLEAEDRNAPFDGRLLALIGGELMQAREYSASADALRRAVAAGQQDELVWLTLAAAYAASDDAAQAKAAIGLGLRAHPSDPLLQAAQHRMVDLPPDTPPAQLAASILPEGPDL